MKECKSSVLVKPKDRGMSFVVSDGCKTYGARNSSGDEIIIHAKNEAEAKKLAEQHFGNKGFTLEERVFLRVNNDWK